MAGIRFWKILTFACELKGTLNWEAFILENLLNLRSYDKGWQSSCHMCLSTAADQAWWRQACPHRCSPKKSALKRNMGHWAGSSCCGEDRFHNFSGSRKLKSVPLVNKSYHSSLIPGKSALLETQADITRNPGPQTSMLTCSACVNACVCICMCLKICVACACHGSPIKPMEKSKPRELPVVLGLLHRGKTTRGRF